MTSLQRAGRVLATIAGFVWIGYGLTRPATGSQGTWLVCLGLGSLCVGVGLWPRRDPQTSAETKPFVNVAASIALIFSMLGVQMARMQVISGETIALQRGTDPNTGEVLSNPRTINAPLVAKRGAIIDRNGEVLARSVRRGERIVREYPVAAASYVCGYFSPLKYGNSGLEETYDAELGGTQSGNPLKDELNTLLGRTPEGSDLRLTLDASLQIRAHELLDGRTGSVIVIDVKTGEILVLASNPYYDPEQLVAIDEASVKTAESYWSDLNADPSRPLLIRSTNGLYTPGSTFKTITAAAAIDLGTGTPDSVYRDDGSLEIDGRILIEENRPDDSIDEWTMRDGIAYSLNVVFAQIGLELGGDTLRRYAERFGFGQEIPFDLPVSPGQVATTPDFLSSDVALADTAFGQGELLVSPLGMVLVAAAFANGGTIMQPYLVDSVVSADGDVTTQAEPAIWRVPVDPNTADQVRDMMINSVEAGYSQSAQIPGIVVGGKTGTAETGDGDPHAWFIGFAGESEPRYAVAVVLEHGGSGTAESLGIAREILAATLDAYR